jgi:hypothetical protein
MANNLTDIYVGVKKNDPNRNVNDLYPTPPLATYVLHKYGNLPHHIVEPCAGRGNISIELIRNGYSVESYDKFKYDNSLCDITTDQDVLTLEKPSLAQALVTNPPYHKDLPRQIALKGATEYDVTALFVRLTFLEGKKRKQLFSDHPPSDIIFLSDRIRFDSNIIEQVERKDQIGGMIAYCWIIFRKDHCGPTQLRWVSLEEEYDEWRNGYDAYQQNILRK